jgi:hypothetical protein
MPVNDLHPSYEENAGDWKLVRDMVAGAKAVRAGGEAYLPKLSAMTYSEYVAYKNRAQFFNATARTLSGLAGVISRKPPTINLGDAESLRPLLDKCTVDNQSFFVFIRNIIRETLTTGRIGAFVDAPVDGGLPYFASYTAENITNWREMIYEGRKVPDQIVLRETVSLPSDFGSSEAIQYRELVLDENGVYVQRVWVPIKSANGQLNYAVQGQYYPRLPGLGFFRNEIPFVVFGPYHTGLVVQRSPMLDIAELNKLHFQRSAQLAHGQFYTATPTYWAVPPAGSSETPEYRVGPNTVWLMDTPNACGILEYRGEGLKYLENACQQLENQMASLGARLVTDRKHSVAESTEVADMRNKGETSILYEIVESIEFGLNELLRIWVRWHGRNPKGVSVQLNRDFVGAPLEYRKWLQLDRAHTTGDIDDETYFKILFEGEMLPSSYGPEDVSRLIDNAPKNREKKAIETQSLEEDDAA